MATGRHSQRVILRQGLLAAGIRIARAHPPRQQQPILRRVLGAHKLLARHAVPRRLEQRDAQRIGDVRRHL
eukprot:CAMPEP_0205888864 /NCGR_PEP_ID=MMETSP1083-20121108/20636_1 /ASSEMBLY_ACC=CAM_ASM_000430 /TAXON_ID=97485 /ORGANISM="Prymnesium parvum, Strain Texoma1" /LENGTH=70 /DNA_ID=CAMNT_0053252875 /DNA_START=77 /DNA_END=286 /DNA_ORIENTATION=+